MNERILIGFKRDGDAVPVTKLHTDEKEGGITLEGETSSFPRGFGLSVSPANPVTKERMFRVQQRLDWLKTRDFKLNVSLQGPRLRLAGFDAEALPAGRYDVELKLRGIRFKKAEMRNVRIQENGSLELTFEEKRPKHRFELNTSVRNFDQDTKTILRASKVDDKQADRWIQPNVRHRDLRKACLMNILAKLAVVPSRQEPLNRFVRKIIFVEQDRVYAEVDPDFFKTVKSEFLRKDGTVHSTHKRLLIHAPGSPGDYNLRSHREKKGSGSLQVIGAVPKKGTAASRDVQFVDIDIDEANPAFDAARFFLHVGHLFRSGKTNHLKLRRKIVSQTSDFLYYNSVEV